MARKLFFTTLILITFLQVGCGKGVKNDETQDEGIEIDRRTASSEFYTLSAQLDTNGNSTLASQSYSEPNEVRIPEVITAQSGDTSNHVAHIYFDALSDSNFWFYCKYVGSDDGLEFIFDDCFTQLNDIGSVNFNPGAEITTNSNKSVILKILGSSPSSAIRANAEIEVLWR